MSLNSLKKLFADLSLLFCTSAFAGPLTFTFTDGFDSVGEFGNPSNTIVNLDVGANSRITSISYAVNVTAYDPSWLDELSFAFTNSKVTEGVILEPGLGDIVPGTTDYSGSIDLVLNGLDFTVGVDGILRLEFFEYYDDDDVFPDGRWNFGSITFGIEPFEEPAPVPEPASALLVAAGLAAMASRRRGAGAKAHRTS
ncbi:PEP-CTERM sorting domain-containing protein [Massilia agri]|uniref:PEP-CTERM sorting domain-containing protein n=1 Tax=Massilia agri TaxID=1886785 RepID=A0ABT2ALT7_9BURK|nr:PEP-CTERM sorting domain-containing protein [Massilia agri]MCS0596688.1 PEP-CTERM sorting domain-containing protein [Massilia agri]